MTLLARMIVRVPSLSTHKVPFLCDYSHMLGQPNIVLIILFSTSFNFWWTNSFNHQSLGINALEFLFSASNNRKIHMWTLHAVFRWFSSLLMNGVCFSIGIAPLLFSHYWFNILILISQGSNGERLSKMLKR